jgi:hypothetical protein
MLYRNDFGAMRIADATDVAYSPHGTETPHPELAGRKARIPGTTPIYVIDRTGYRRRVPFPLTFLNLFGDISSSNSMMVSADVADIAIGPALDERAILVRGTSSESVYLIDSGTKRLIDSPKVMNKYGFDERCIVSVPQVLIDSIPEGEVWE